MNTNQLKKFAQEARKKLIGLVGAKLEKVLTQDSVALRTKASVIESLKEELSKTSKEVLIDKVAYTWFNRLVALRFMDANDFQPLGINVLSPAPGVAGSSSQLLSDIQAGIFPSELNLDNEYIMAVLNRTTPSNNPDDTVFRLVLIAVCNDLHRIFPFLFERIDDYTELLLPDDLTSSFSIVSDIVNGMSTEDCQEVEIIGWLYQFYISEKKDEVFSAKGKVEKEDIPAATQLFTPRWIVEYMVQNTVGKLWLQNNPGSDLRNHMPYYIEAPEETTTSEFLKVECVEDIKLLDQACGSGHILVYGFELFTKIYEEQGYSPSDIPALIIQNNLIGFEIDERAAQLAGFAIIMKARAYHRRFFRKAKAPHILCFKDIYFVDAEISEILRTYDITPHEQFHADLEIMAEATNLGSLIQPQTSLDDLIRIQDKIQNETTTTLLFEDQQKRKLLHALHQLIPLQQKYHCVVDNPPYMGGGKMNTTLSSYVKEQYPNSKSDLMACFMESGLFVLEEKGYLGMINQHSWMFLSSYESLRNDIINKAHIDTLLHLGARTFPEIGGEVVQNAAFTFSKSKCNNIGSYIRLVDYDSTNLKKDKTLEAIRNPKCGWFYTANQKDFEKIPGSNIGYWLSEKLLSSFRKGEEDIINPKQGLATTNNNRFLRFWSEVSINKMGVGQSRQSFISRLFRWAPYNKGGEFKKWYGNQSYVVNWLDDGEEIKILVKAKYKDKSYAQGFSDEKWDKLIQVWVVKNIDSYFKEAITWSFISSSSFGVRHSPKGFIFDVAGSSIFPKESEMKFLLGFLNTKITKEILQILNPTLNYQVGDMRNIPIINPKGTNCKVKISNIVAYNIVIAKKEWDSRETSWDFVENELARIQKEDSSKLISESMAGYISYWRDQFFQLHQNEETLNREFIEIYELEDELTPDVPLEDITLLKDETKISNGELIFQENEIIAQLISYAVGCIFGRYSLDKEGLILANQGENLADYIQKVGKGEADLSFIPDEDNVVPLLDEEWFDDDIVNRVREFISAVWGADQLQTNIDYIEQALGKDLRKYLIRDFYKDHIKRYKKRPIYWMFSSPKGSFNVLIYMHRYTQDTISTILNGYLRPFMEKIRNEMQRQQDIIIAGSASEQGRARKREDQLADLLMDCEKYEHDILYPLAGERISIDLDDGVLVNYNKFGEAIAPVAGLNDTKTKKKVKGFDWIDTTTIR